MEPINWHELTPVQHDSLIAEIVFGWQWIPASQFGPHVKKETNWLLPKDGLAGIKSDLGADWIAVAENRMAPRNWIPRYSQSMDAAWLLWPKLAEGDDGTAFVRQCKFMCAWTEDDDVEHYDWRTYNAYRPFLEIGDMSNVTPERICIAMLRAYDYEVLTEEVSQ